MSINFHANQYEKAFASHRLQNWETPKSAEGKHPKSNIGFTRVVANERGHLLPNVPRNRSSPWGTYVGTWDLPKKIPGNRILNPTARSEEALLKNMKAKEESDCILSGALKKRHTVEPLPIKMDAPEAPVGVICEPAIQPECNAPSPQVEPAYCNVSQSLDAPVQESRENLHWPKAKSPVCRSPDNHSPLPKPMTTMYANSPVLSRGECQQCQKPISN